MKIDYEGLGKFLNEMMSLLEVKQLKYGDTWKTCYFLDLKQQLQNRVITLGLTSNRTQRKLLHIALYCYFLYTRLGNK